MGSFIFIHYSSFHANYRHRHDSMIYIHTHPSALHGNYVKGRQAIIPL